MVMNIVYSTVVACLVEVFLIANVSMISSYPVSYTHLTLPTTERV